MIQSFRNIGTNIKSYCSFSSVIVPGMGLPRNAKKEGPRDPREESLEEAIFGIFQRVLALLGSPCPPGAPFIKKSNMAFNGLIRPLRGSIRPLRAL